MHALILRVLSYNTSAIFGDYNIKRQASLRVHEIVYAVSKMTNEIDVQALPANMCHDLELLIVQ